MKAIVQYRYGPTSVLKVADVPKPTVKDGEVLIRVRAASVNMADRYLMRGEPYMLRLMFGGA